MDAEVEVRLQAIERRLDAVDTWRAGQERWRNSVDEQNAAIADMIALFRAIESGLWLFVKVGNGLKWAVGVAVSVAAPGAALWYWLKEHWK